MAYILSISGVKSDFSIRKAGFTRRVDENLPTIIPRECNLELHGIITRWDESSQAGSTIDLPFV